MARYQSTEHARRFPGGLFASEIDKAMSREDPGSGRKARIYVTPDNLREAIGRVEVFCGFVEANRPFF